MKNDAMERIFKKHFNEVKLYVFSLCRNTALAEDIVSEAFYKAFISIDEDRDNFKYWLFKVARNCYFDYLRKNKRITELNNEICADDFEMVSELIQKEEYCLLYSAIARLDNKYREAVQLYYFDGLAVMEVAGITEQSVENIKVILYRARIKLRKILEEKNEF